MQKKPSLETSAHVQTFSSAGTYSINDNLISLATEIPTINLSGASGETYSLKLQNCYDISSPTISCMLSVYGHGHPTDREKLNTDNLDWDHQELELDSVFSTQEFTHNKILVITVHDEDYQDWHKEVYRFFAEYHVSYDTTSNKFDFDIKTLQEFIDGKFVDPIVEEEPKTVGGGVLDPAGIIVN